MTSRTLSGGLAYWPPRMSRLARTSGTSSSTSRNTRRPLRSVNCMVRVHDCMYGGAGVGRCESEQTGRWGGVGATATAIGTVDGVAEVLIKPFG